MNTSGRIKRIELSGDDDDFLSQDFERQAKEKKKKKKKKKLQKQQALNGTTTSGSGVKQLYTNFNQKEAKNNWNNTILKTVVDLVGVGLGTTVSATTGKAAPILAAAFIGAGHYIGDKSGLLRVIGASTLSHSVAKAKEYREQPDKSVGERLKGLKDDWLYAAMLKHSEEKQKSTSASKEPLTNALMENVESDASNLDLEGLNFSPFPSEVQEAQNQLMREFDEDDDESFEEEESDFNDEEDDEDREYEQEGYPHDQTNYDESSPDWNAESDHPSNYLNRRNKRGKADQPRYYSEDEIHRILNGDLPDTSQL